MGPFRICGREGRGRNVLGVKVNVRVRVEANNTTQQHNVETGRRPLASVPLK